MVADGQGGQVLTTQPTVRIPKLKSYILDEFGKPAISPEGGFQENDPPGIESLVGSNECGQQWRIQGRSGFQQKLYWDGCKFVFRSDDTDKSLDEYTPIDSPGDQNSYEAVITVKADGSAVIGYRTTPSVAPGCCMIWPGLINAIPTGWLPCDGVSYETTEYPQLFLAIGYSHGNDGGKFRVPDPRGYMVRFQNNLNGIDLNAATRTAKYPGGNSGDNVGSVQEMSAASDLSTNRLWNMYFNMIIFPGIHVPQ